MDTNLHKELELIQSIINRMANNSFLIKGWTITLISLLLAVGKDSITSDKGFFYLIIVLVVLIPFWWLDAFYLKQERFFRAVYNRAVNLRNEEGYVPFCMKDRNDIIKKEIDKLSSPMFSHSTFWFYFPLILLILLGLILKMMGKL